MLRTLFFQISIPVLIAFFGPLVGLNRLLGGDERGACRIAARPICRALVRTAGLEIDSDLSALPEKGPYVIVANHQGLLDFAIIYKVLPPIPFVFLAKQELFKLPVLGQILSGSGHLSIDRTNRRQAVRDLEQVKLRLERGTSVTIFAEGTRARDLSKLRKFQSGAAVIAIKCGVPVVPLVISGVGDVSPGGGLKLAPAPRRVKIRALAPVDTAAYSMADRRQLLENLYESMNSAYVEMRAAT